MPYADLGELERDRRPGRIDDLFTVGLLVDYVRWRLGSGGPAEGLTRAICFLERGPSMIADTMSRGSSTGRRSARTVQTGWCLSLPEAVQRVPP